MSVELLKGKKAHDPNTPILQQVTRRWLLREENFFKRNLKLVRAELARRKKSRKN